MSILMASLILWPVLSPRTGFVQGDRRGVADIEALETAGHGDSRQMIAMLGHQPANAFALGPQHQNQFFQGFAPTLLRQKLMQVEFAFASKADADIAVLVQGFKSAGQVGHAREGDDIDGADGRLG